MMCEKILNLNKYCFIYHNIDKNNIYDHNFENLQHKCKLINKQKINDN